MISTWIAIASLIPGLGFLLLGKWKSAVLTWVTLIPVTAFLLMTIQIDTLRCLVVNIFFVAIIWIIQWARAYKLARIIDQLNQGEIALLGNIDVQTIKFDQSPTYTQREHMIMGKRLETHILAGESLIVWLMGENRFKDTVWGDRNVCAGLLESDLLICEFGVFDYPETVKRIPLANVQLFSGSRNGRNLLWIVDKNKVKGKKSTIFIVRDGYQQLLKIFNEHAQVKPMFKK